MLYGPNGNCKGYKTELLKLISKYNWKKLKLTSIETIDIICKMNGSLNELFLDSV